MILRHRIALPAVLPRDVFVVFALGLTCCVCPTATRAAESDQLAPLGPLQSSWPIVERLHGDAPIAVQVHAAFLGRNEALPVRARYVAVDITVENRSSSAIECDLRQAVAELNGVTVTAADAIAPFRNARFTYFSETYRVQKRPDDSRAWTTSDDSAFVDDEDIDGMAILATAEDVRAIEAGESRRLLLGFAGFPTDQTPPNLTLRWPGLSQPLDLTDLATKRARVSVDLTGPRNCVGVVGIDGPLDRLGLRVINDSIETLAKRDVGRIVIHLDDGAELSEPRIAQWLRFSIASPRTARMQYADIEMLTNGISRPVIADPKQLFRAQIGRLDQMTQTFVRESLADGVAVAIADVATRLTRDDIVRELRSPSTAGTTAAILRSAGDKLTPFDEPLVQRYVNSESLDVRLAALDALSWFRSESSVASLQRALDSSSLTERRRAVSALLDSQADVPVATLDGLAKVVANDDRGLEVLASDPRPAWKPVFLDAIQRHDTDLQRAAVRGLARLGDAAFRPVLVESLQGDNSDLQPVIVDAVKAADNIEWTQTATDIAVRRLATGPVDAGLMDLIVTARDPNTVDPALTYLTEMSTGAGIRAVQLIGAMASQQQEDALVALLPQLIPDHVDVARHVVQTLFRRQSPHRFDVARDLLANHSDTFRGPLLAEIAKDGTRDAEQLILDQFVHSEDGQLWPYLKQHVVAIGGDRAMQAIRAVFASGTDDKARVAADTRVGIWRRSPASALDRAGMSAQEGDNFKEAERLFSQALALDSAYVPALTNRGMLYLQWPGGARFDDAIRDYTAASQIAQNHLAAEVGLALALASRGDLRQAVDRIEAVPSWARRGNFIDEYNVACVYGIARRQLLDRVASETPAGDLTGGNDLDKDQAARLASDFLTVGLETLEGAVEIGFRGDAYAKHMLDDEDIESLRGERFDGIVNRARKYDTGDGNTW